MPRTTTDKKTDSQRKSPPAPRPDGLTVAWMLTLVTALVCELCAAASRAYVRFVRPEAATISLLAGVSLFAAAVIGTVLLVMTPIVVYRKRSNPPRGIVVAAYVVSVLPWLGMLWQAISWRATE